MTTTPVPPATGVATATGEDLALRAATAAAGVLPAPAPLSAAGARTAEDSVVSGFAAAAVADVQGALAGRVAVVVGQDLVSALAQSPMGALDLAAAAQPALDAMAAELGASAGAARQVDLPLVIGELGAATAVPLITAIGIPGAAVLVSDALLVAAPEQPAAPQAPTPAFPSAVPAADLPGAAGMAAGGLGHRGLEMLAGVDMEVTVELGRARMTVRELLALAPGAVLELDRAAGSPADLLVNGRLIARGEVVVVDENFGLRVTQIVEDSDSRGMNG